ncbi:MAG: hypothetical protein DRJ67_12405 [Thermoprotei archaeon]|nr:MAG: hypothetical protein DRJ67_12405 [Thermoprotei archaeon]
MARGEAVFRLRGRELSGDELKTLLVMAWTGWNALLMSYIVMMLGKARAMRVVEALKAKGLVNEYRASSRLRVFALTEEGRAVVREFVEEARRLGVRCPA